MRKISIMLIVALIALIAPVMAQETLENKADHDALRAMLADGVQAINRHDIEGIIKHFHPNVNVVFPNMEAADGIDEVRNFYSRMLGENNPVLTNISTEAEALALSDLYDNTATAYGTMLTNYTFTGGSQLEVPTMWTATLIKEDGKWMVISLQFSANLFDNPLLTKATSSAVYFGIGGLLIGLLLGYLLLRFRRSKSS